MNIGTEIAASHGALAPEQAAMVIYRGLFENGPARMSSGHKFVAVATITGGLIEWKKQLLAGTADEANKWKKKYEDAKAELDDVRLKLAILQKER